MKNKLFYKRFFLLIFFLNFTLTFANNKLFISYGESIKKQVSISKNQIIFTQWEIISDYKTYKGEGASVFEYIFTEPGKYLLKIRPVTIKFPHEHFDSCSILHNPIEYEVIVSNVKMKFIFEELTFSKPLTGGKILSDITIQVPAIVETYDGKPFIYKDGIINTAGIETSIKGELIHKKSKLKIGKNIISYKLSGEAKNGTYIMFDFYSADGSIQSYSLTTPI